ncbi:MAG TPA: NAD(P)/FAD-dependent oxidoreductase [Acidimicrobiia bacterium]|nr:NAD(P)/FAD-dependent oxidoreductase [Acidimicrobiia bacterium]
MSVAAVDGRIGLPVSVAALRAQRWDVIVVGAGHNGLVAAAYLAGAGRSVLVLERREQVGGACTIERPFPDDRFVVSPCAYLVGLLDPRVLTELDLAAYGLSTIPIDPTQWTPFEDGTALFQWQDRAETARSVAEVNAADVDGFLDYEALFDRIRAGLRRGPLGDTWEGDAPIRADVAALFGDDPEAREVLLDASIADVVERHVRDERLRTALHGQGLIGTFAGPRDPGTAWVHAHHRLGLIGGWQFVAGGMGQISFALADAARAAGAVVTSGTPVAAIEPGEGVRLAGGDRIAASTVVANVDPKRLLGLLDGDVPQTFIDRVEAWQSASPVIKLNCALDRLPTFPAAAGDRTCFRAQVEIARSIDDTQVASVEARAGRAAPEWCELYFQTAYDPSVAAPGCHTMAVFAQYAPHELTAGGWDDQRDRIADATVDAVARFAPDVADCIIERQVLGPPDVEARIGLTGGHIFQGEILPDQMWERRFAPRTPVPGVYLCGAATHPGGSVMGINGRNAAVSVLHDLASTSTVTR